MDDEEFDMMLFLFLKLRKKSSQNVKKGQRFWIRNIFEKRLFLCAFLTFVKQARIFLNFFGQWSVIPLGSIRVGGFLILLS